MSINLVTFFLSTFGGDFGTKELGQLRIPAAFTSVKLHLNPHPWKSKGAAPGNALLDYAVKKDDELRHSGEQDRIDDKTVVIIKRD